MPIVSSPVDSNPVVMCALTLMSVTLSCSLIVGWASLGRPRHALLWAAAFGVGGAQWAVMGLRGLQGIESPASTLATSALGVGFTLLLLAGFKTRTASPIRDDVGLAIVIGSAAAVGLALQYSQPGLAKAIPQFVRALLLPLAAITMSRRPGGRSPTEVFAVGVLIVFAALSLVVGLLRVCGTSESSDLARLLIMVGLPVVYANVGAATLLLLASDLSGTLERLAETDPLTGVLNRRGLESAASAFGRKLDRATVLLLDLDGFKSVNDNEGHAIGDAVLIALAGCLKEAVRADDVVARLGGDEFAILLAEPGEVGGERIAERIRFMLRDCVATGLKGSLPTVSIGIAAFSPGATLQEVISDADHALYRSKAHRAALASERSHSQPRLTLVKRA